MYDEMSKKIDINDILFKCKDLLNNSLNSATDWKKRDIIITLTFLYFINKSYEDYENCENCENTLNSDDKDSFCKKYIFPKEARWSLLSNTAPSELNAALDKALQTIAETSNLLKQNLIPNFFTTHNLNASDIKNIFDEINKLSLKECSKNLYSGCYIYNRILDEFSVSPNIEEKKAYTCHNILTLILFSLPPWNETFYNPLFDSTTGTFRSKLKQIRKNRIAQNAGD